MIVEMFPGTGPGAGSSGGRLAERLRVAAASEVRCRSLSEILRSAIDHTAVSFTAARDALLQELGRPGAQALHVLRPGHPPVPAAGQTFALPPAPRRRILSAGLGADGSMTAARRAPATVNVSALEFLRAVWPSCTTVDMLATWGGDQFGLLEADALALVPVSGRGAAVSAGSETIAAVAPEASTASPQSDADAAGEAIVAEVLRLKQENDGDARKALKKLIAAKGVAGRHQFEDEMRRRYDALKRDAHVKKAAEQLAKSFGVYWRTITKWAWNSEDRLAEQRANAARDRQQAGLSKSGAAPKRR